MTRDIRISARIQGILYKKVKKEAEERKWSISDCVEEGLKILCQKN